MPGYDPHRIEPKWQAYWEAHKTFRAEDLSDKPKLYVLDMFPYPSAAGLHVGHPVGYVATDVIARHKRMAGFNVLHPMGYDAFGLPAEQHAIDTGTHPAETTERNIANIERQIRCLGFSYDWDRKVNTTDPGYYKWTQWIFLQLYRKGLAYQERVPVNWCPALGTVLANEEVTNEGRSERGNHPVVRRPLRQWMLRITAYAERLLDDLDTLDWPESIKEMQRNWIGKSTGADVDFYIGDAVAGWRETRQAGGYPESAGDDVLRVYTTRPDTLFGATYMVLSPEHPLVERLTVPQRRNEVQAYCREAARKSDLARTDLARQKTGIFTGSYAINPVNDQRVPIWVADYVLISYGTGAIMAVPAHDERDYEFAVTFDLPIIEVVRPPSPVEGCFAGDGTNVNSVCEALEVRIDGLPTPEAKKTITQWLADNGLGRASVNYRLRDWLFSRQRYWGEPFPLLHGPDGKVVPVDESELPVVLPEVEDYRPTTTETDSDLLPEPPLSRAADWVTVTRNGKTYRRETNTMPQWAGSCWYYLRYLDPNNDTAPWDKQKERYWMPVDLYVGGAEHAVLHLLYARFWHKVLYDIGWVSTPEPFQKLFNQGMILSTAYRDARGAYVGYDEVEQTDAGPVRKGTDQPLIESTEKMSKSLKNTIDPVDMVSQHGADTLRLYELAMGPLESTKPWNMRDVEGMWRFLNRTWRLVATEDGQLAEAVQDVEPSADQLRILHKTIQAVTGRIETMRFNTAISQMIVFVNEFTQMAVRPRSCLEAFLLVLSPFAPHLCEELWEILGHTGTLAYEPWPQWDEQYVREETIEVVVQVNGKVRSRLTVAADTSEDALRQAALDDPKIQSYTAGKEIRKIVVARGKIVNVVVG